VDMMDYARRFVVIACVMVLLVSNAVTLPVLSATQHGCAPATPPPVAGPLVQPDPTPQVIFLNEVLTNPASIWNCSELGTSSTGNDAWVELYNPQGQAFDLYAVHSYLDTGPNTTPFYFPLGSAIAAHGFFVVFPPQSIFAPLLSANGSLTLRFLINSALVDQVTLIPLLPDTSYARVPDGGSTWQVLDAPTIDTSDDPATPTPTQVPTPSPAQLDSHNSSIQSETSTDATKQALGTQPAWNILSVPTTAPHFPRTTTQRTIPASPAQQPPATGIADLPQKVLLSSLAVVLVVALLWTSYFFSRTKKVSLPSQKTHGASHSKISPGGF
jgi:hypothetical protein